MLQQYNSKNADIQVWVNGLCHRNSAKVSVFDSVVQGGDAVWEGLRVYQGGIFCLDKHLERLEHSAKALAFSEVPTREEIKKAIFTTLQANGMRHETHIRLTLTRGEKVTSGMDPRLNTKGTTLIVLAEWKPLVYDNDKGIRVISSSIQRNSPRFLDSKIHHNNLLNNILAKIQANVAGADAALMLDANGFVAELNDTNLFMAKVGVLYTPHADACLHGITRGLVIELGRELGLQVVEKNLSLTEFYNADEVFCCGTMGELTPVVAIDGRKIENNWGSSLKDQVHAAFERKVSELSEPLPF
ncbi:branched-chain amino acid aminotransferase/4-amino-4-deoxychorismate lyase [Flammeovirgaceae bacterium 311]|nr:branched-chain amino acid aminotransferase/4-amino-4-deoxychorismate lyase [Flammeovirgaceae bacterium 311]